MITRVKKSSFSCQDIFNYANVYDSGAIGDGVTDDTAAINTALAIGIPVFFPAGTFLCSGITVPANSVIFGTGASSILKLKNTSNIPVLTVGSGTSVRDIAIDGNKAGQVGSVAHGIAFVNSITSHARNVNISSTAGDGINISGAATQGVKVITCSITSFTRNGVSVVNGTYITLESTTCYSSDVAAAPGDGFSIAAEAVGTALNMVTITSCIARSNIGRGFSFLGNGSKNVSNVTIRGCIAGSNTSHGFHALTAQQITFSGCIARLNLGDGFRLEGDTQFCRLAESFADTNTNFGIREITAGTTPNNNKVIYSVSTGNGTNTITIVGGASANVP